MVTKEVKDLRLELMEERKAYVASHTDSMKDFYVPAL
jgi:hypothetical protein